MPKSLETTTKENTEHKFYLVREIVNKGDVLVENIAYVNNIVDPSTKTLPAQSF